MPMLFGPDLPAEARFPFPPDLSWEPNRISKFLLAQAFHRRNKGLGTRLTDELHRSHFQFVWASIAQLELLPQHRTSNRIHLLWKTPHSPQRRSRSRRRGRNRGCGGARLRRWLTLGLAANLRNLLRTIAYVMNSDPNRWSFTCQSCWMPSS